MTGFRLDTARIRKRLERVQGSVRADEFLTELRDFAKATLETCVDQTPARDAGTIKANQSKQYANRVDYIESIHWDTADPRLIVKDSGEFLYSGGKWYRPDVRKLPDKAWNDYRALHAERERRLQTRESDFVSNRVQARFLYKRSWIEVAMSLGIKLANATAEIVASHTRRKPAKNPPRGSGQVLGGKFVISIPIRNPFLEMSSDYKSFSGKAILDSAVKAHRKNFLRIVEAKVKRLVRAAAKVAA